MSPTAASATAKNGTKSVVYDMTSDTATIPTDDMFDLMKTASRGDDVFAADSDVNDLEAYMADMLGQEAALFCVSGTMTNQLGLRALLSAPPQSVLCDARAHIHIHECGGLGYHSQAMVIPVTPKNGAHLTAEDVEANINADELCGAPTKVVALENTLNGTIMPYEEIKRIRAVVDKHGIKLHLDGARLWNASAATGVSMADYGKLFDTVSVCLSKGAGAPIGSIIAGPKDLIRRTRHLRKLFGGGWRQAGCLARVARHCIDTVVPKLPETHALAVRLAQHLQSLGVKLLLPCHTNMLFIDVAPMGIMVDELAAALKQKNIKISAFGGSTISRVVLHYQITEQAVQDFMDVASELAAKAKANGFVYQEPKSDAEKVEEANQAVDLRAAYPSGKN
ncbi:pyridoxal phosphate-dependent transferase [Syncephalastrum racemosum]|uniref:Pyridoxal phosphate-dependent transferase n=1 Tax=Syncephalastrum racemosum TaxID=13706 RepID=A0A1X2H371_SYNRA|nr:pyridoxal phosphate-dependent transferase [Syncephalastrum racemosum]